MTGYFKVRRRLLESSLWKSEPFTRGQAWVDLFGLANHAEGYIFKRGIKIDLDRGQNGRAETTLAERWQWSRNKVRRFLRWLEKEEMILLKKDNKTTTITICNYEIYQGSEIDDDTPNDTPNDTPERHQKDTRRYSNKKKENNKNEKNKESIVWVVDYLNKICGTNYKSTTDKTKSVITARINNGFEGKDFKKVIDNKFADWKGGEHEKYLRPSTLFGAKFEEYLNQKINQPGSESNVDDGSAKAARRLAETNRMLENE